MKKSVWATAIAFGLIAVLVFWRYWGGNEITFDTFFVATTIGVAIGSLYAIYATGLVVVYTTTGVFNFAQGAIGVLAAFLYWELHVNRGLHSLPSLIAALIICCLLGILLDVAIMRKLRNTSLVVQLMVTVAIMVLLLALVGDIWNADQVRRVDFLFGNNGVRIFGVNILWHRIIVFCAAGLVAIGLRLFLRRTRLGIAMRSVVDNRDLAGLSGARPNLISSSAWALGSGLAGLGGILIAPEIALDPANLNIIIITAFAGAACGGLKNLPLAFGGAIGIGLLIQHARTWLDFGVDLRFAPDSVAPFVLFAVVIALPQSRLAVGRIVSNLKSRERLTKPWEAIVGGGILVLLAVALSGGWLNFGIWDPGPWGGVALNNAVFAMTLALIGISLVPLTGWAGQINFAPIAFAGFGAFVYFRFVGGDQFGQGWWLLLVALIAAPVGALIALPAARLTGVYLALGSMAFAQGMALLFFPHSSITPVTGAGIQYPPIQFFGFNFKDDRSEFIMLMFVFAAFVIGLVFLRHSRYGRRWVALNDSQVASATSGVNVVWTKVIIYSLSASMAAVAGAFWAIAQGNVDGVRGYDLQLGWEIVLLMAAAGISLPAAGLFLSFRFLIAALGDRLADTGDVEWLVTILGKLEIYGPGLLALGMVINPRGVIYEIGRGFAPMLPWRKDAREAQRLENLQKRDKEIGELGLTEEFTPDEIMSLDRTLDIASDVVPKGGYKNPSKDTSNGAKAKKKTKGKNEPD